jgi:phosphodiesterase/alkaline phosphatase D-like protein
MKKVFNLTLVGLLLLLSEAFSQSAVSIVRGPYLQIGTSTSIILKWKTNIATDSKVRYGTSAQNLSGTLSNTTESSLMHEVQIKGLKPSTKYYYSVETSTTVLQGNLENYFITSPAPGTKKPTRIWVIGDAGTNATAQNQVRDAYYKYTGNKPTDVWLW